MIAVISCPYRWVLTVDIFDVARTCLRRWRVFVPLIIVTVVLAGLAYAAVPTVHQAESTVGLAPSPVSGSEGNGILNNGGTLLLANLTATGLSSPTIGKELVASTGATNFTADVVTVPGGQMPLVSLITTAHDPETAARALDLAHVRAQEVVDRIQADAGIPERSYGIVYQVSYGPVLNELRPGRKRLLAGVLGLGLIASVLAALAWDAVARRPDKVGILEDGKDEGRPLNDEDRYFVDRAD